MQQLTVVAIGRALLVSLRPYQWTKNLLVFAALIFARRWGDQEAVASTVTAFALFCLVASGVYLQNDVNDREADRNHPTKKDRPVAHGDLPVPLAVGTAVLLLAAGLGLSFRLSGAFGAVLLGYAALMVAYSAFLKHLIVFDVLIVATGMVFRAVAGAVAIPVAISAWFLADVSLLALLVAVGKRRQELFLLQGEAAHHRRTLRTYAPRALDATLVAVATAAVITYVLYTVAPTTVAHVGSPALLLTVPLVILAILRYLHLLYEKHAGGDPTTMMTDRPMLGAIGLWLIAVLVILTHAP